MHDVSSSPWLLSGLDEGGQALEGAELQRFEDVGWAGPFPLLSEHGVRELSARRAPLEARCCEAEGRWFKSVHAVDDVVADIAASRPIVDRMRALLGPDIIAWGASFTWREPGQVHRWHVDVEHVAWPGVTVFIGLEGSSAESSLKVISRSHRLDESPQRLGLTSDADVLAACQARIPGADLANVAIGPGSFFMFSGRLWHGSHNLSAIPRAALLLQYARPDARIRIPLTFDDPVSWHAAAPPCLLVSGRDRHGVNAIVPSPCRQA